MNYPISIACSLLFSSLLCTAQSAISISTLGSVTIHLRNPDELSFHGKVFAHFEVIDERPDTARIGVHLYVPTFGWNRARQLVFHRPVAAELADYLNAGFARPGAPYTALIVLRDLWLSDANYLREDMLKDPDKLHERTHIRLKAELYATKDSLFIPVLRFDTTQVYKQDNRYTGDSYYASWGYNLAGILNNMADSAGRLANTKDGHSRLVSRADIEDFNHSRFVAPIGIAADLTAGVYASFDEFRNNTPSIRDFEIKMEHKERLLYIREPNGKSYYSHDAWGYCDGKDIFIMRDGMLCQAWREGGAFYFHGGTYREVIVPPGFIGLGKPGVPNTGTGQVYNPSNVNNSGQAMEVKARTIFMIDMDSGAVY